jgi:hypothetical protein
MRLNPRRRVAVAASAAHPDLRPDWPLLQRSLAVHSIEATAQVWTDPEVAWDEFDLVVANGAWDNIHRPEEFLAWIDRVDAVVPLVNSPATLRWNLDKHYLADLAAAGIPTVPTTWIGPETDAGATPLTLPEIDNGDIVVKPGISGGGFETARYSPDERSAAVAHIERLIASGRTALVQPYQSAVDAQGEVGLIYLGGRYSHTIGKNPLLVAGVGVQDNLWDRTVIVATDPTVDQLDTAHAALAAAEHLVGPPVYARVDMVALDDGTPAVLELELLDPALFFECSPPAAQRFADVLLDQIVQSRNGST